MCSIARKVGSERGVSEPLYTTAVKLASVRILPTSCLPESRSVFSGLCWEIRLPHRPASEERVSAGPESFKLHLLPSERDQCLRLQRRREGWLRWLQISRRARRRTSSSKKKLSCTLSHNSWQDALRMRSKNTHQILTFVMRRIQPQGNRHFGGKGIQADSGSPSLEVTGRFAVCVAIPAPPHPHPPHGSVSYLVGCGLQSRKCLRAGSIYETRNCLHLGNDYLDVSSLGSKLPFGIQPRLAERTFRTRSCQTTFCPRRKPMLRTVLHEKISQAKNYFFNWHIETPPRRRKSGNFGEGLFYI